METGDDGPCYGETDSKDHIISALKGRVADLEEMNKEAKRSKNRCLICLVNLIQFKSIVIDNSNQFILKM